MTDHPAPRENNLHLGILWMLGTMLMFVSMDTCAKILVASYPTMQVVWGRYFFQVVILVIVLAPRLPSVLKTESLPFQLLRSLFLLGATLCFFTGLETVQVAEASSIMFTAPLMVTLMAPFVLREKVGVRRILSVLIGFIGALVIIRPGFDAMEIGAFWIVGAAACYACYQISTRALSQQDSVVTTLFYSALLGSLIMSAILPFHFQTPDVQGWALMALAGLFGTLGHFCMIKAFTHAEASQVAPYSYSSLIWATILGFLLFGDLPDVWTYIGAVIVVCSGLYILQRERATRQPKNP